MESAVLIGDLVESRLAHDRSALQDSLKCVLARVEGLVPSTQSLRPTLGDEFQGVFPTVAAALRASLLLRLLLGASRPTSADCRCGIGWGDFEVFDADAVPVSQDGPAWWAARRAIQTAAMLAGKRRTRFARVRFQPAGAPSHAFSWSVNALLIERDWILEQMTGKQRLMLLRALEGATQVEIAEELSMTQGAVSQAMRRSGAAVVLLSQEEAEAYPWTR